MDRPTLYRRILVAGGIWNLAMGIPIAILVPWLPALIHIDPPLYPIFIYFNLMTVTMFGFVALTIARHLDVMRPMMLILMWSKVLTAAVFVAAVIWLPTPRELSEFLAPGMAVDLGLGIAYGWIWRETAPRTA